MGVDHDGVGGIGVEITSEMVAQLIENGKFSEDDWDDDAYSCLDELGIEYQKAGAGDYGGQDRWYWMTPGKTLAEINQNAPDFITRLQSIGINISVDELRVIEDLHVH